MTYLTPYSDTSGRDRTILDLLAQKLKQAGYTPKTAWKRENGEYEVYSKERDSLSPAKVAAYIVLRNDSGEMVVPGYKEYIKLSGKDLLWIETIEYRGIRPYKEASASQKAVFREMARRIREKGYTAGSGWIRDGKSYELYSLELKPGGKGETACVCMVKEDGIGYLKVEEKKEPVKISIEKEIDRQGKQEEDLGL